jgi:hypothetical protein
VHFDENYGTYFDKTRYCRPAFTLVKAFYLGLVWFTVRATLLKRQKLKCKWTCPCALTKHHAMKAYWGSGGMAPRILDLGTRWR